MKTYLQNQSGNKVLLFFLGIALCHATVLFGINLSLADIFIVVLLSCLLFEKRLRIPRIYFSFFLFIGIGSFIAAFWIHTNVFELVVPASAVFKGLVKMGIVFLYLLLGYHSTQSDREWVYHGFACGTLLMAILSVIYSVFSLQFLRNILYYWDVRFFGLMNDPNYFALLQILGILYFHFSKRIHDGGRILAIGFLIFSILASGSKSGVLTLLLVGIVLVVEERTLLKHPKILFGSLFFVGFIIFAAYFFRGGFLTFQEVLTGRLPAFSRFTGLITDFQGAISADGSTRDIAFRHGLFLIAHSPLFGVGVGAYSDLTRHLFGDITLAHNTYIQMAAEWGLPLTIFLWTYVIHSLNCVGTLMDGCGENKKFLYACIVLMISSLALSLNHARHLWLLIGALDAIIQKNQQKILQGW